MCSLLRHLLILLRAFCVVASDGADACDCAATLAKNPGLNRFVLGKIVGEDDSDISVAIPTRDFFSFTFKEYMESFFSMGVPVIITGVGSGGGGRIFSVAGHGNPLDKQGDERFKMWFAATFGDQRFVEYQKLANGDGTFTTTTKEVGGGPFVDKAMQNALKNENKSIPDFTGLYEQIIERSWSFPPSKPFRPLRGLWEWPHFLPFEGWWGGDTDGSVYVGGPSSSPGGKFVPRHQDFGSCEVGVQVQVRGSKSWKIQSPLSGRQLESEPFGFVMGDKNVVFEGTVGPGEMIIFPVQAWHSTSGPDFSFALMKHFSVALASRVYEKRNDRKTFQRDGETRQLPINMFYQKLLAHYACSKKMGGFYCGECVLEWQGRDFYLEVAPKVALATAVMLVSVLKLRGRTTTQAYKTK